MDTFFAPANDPFESANALAEIVAEQNKLFAVTNLYLCPVSTKVQIDAELPTTDSYTLASKDGNRVI